MKVRGRSVNLSLLLVINMEMQRQEEKACNCEISARRSLPASLALVGFLSVSLSLALSFLNSLQYGAARDLMRVNDWGIQAPLWTKQIIIVRSKGVQRRS